MHNNRSLAIWCNARPQLGPVVIETHFNYWRVAGDEEFRRKNAHKSRDFIEIGLMISNPSHAETISIFMPHELRLEDIHDCSDYFRDANISQGIFNEILSSTNQSATQRFVLLSTSTKVFCRVHRFIINNATIDPSELTSRYVSDGTLLTITRQAIDEACRHGAAQDRVYFRLRIFLDGTGQKTYVRRVSVPDRLFQSGSEEIEYIDFRLNEARTLPPQIEAMMAANNYGTSTQIELVAFLTAVPVQSQLAVSSAPSHKLRLLEHSLWSNYVPTGIPNGMVVYHWKKSENKRIADFSAFVKLQTRRSGRYTLIKYLAFAFIFGVFGNLAASAIQAGFENIFAKEAPPPPPPPPPPPKPMGDGSKLNGPVSPATNPVKGGR